MSRISFLTKNESWELGAFLDDVLVDDDFTEKAVIPESVQIADIAYADPKGLASYDQIGELCAECPKDLASALRKLSKRGMASLDKKSWTLHLAADKLDVEYDDENFGCPYAVIKPKVYKPKPKSEDSKLNEYCFTYFTRFSDEKKSYVRAASLIEALKKFRRNRRDYSLVEISSIEENRHDIYKALREAHLSF